MKRSASLMALLAASSSAITASWDSAIMRSTTSASIAEVFSTMCWRRFDETNQNILLSSSGVRSGRSTSGSCNALLSSARATMRSIETRLLVAPSLRTRVSSTVSSPLATRASVTRALTVARTEMARR